MLMSISRKIWRNASRHSSILKRTMQTSMQHEDLKEVEHHGKILDWWNPSGSLAALHALNEIRVPFIRDGLVARNAVDGTSVETDKVFKNLNILEIGCGGGILTERLARLQANVTAIDLGQEVIKIAKDHLETDSPELLDRIKYSVESIEEHSEKNKNKYDACVISEVLEHVSDKSKFLKASIDTVKSNGSIFITTPNRTIPMYLGGIFLAENVLNIVPKGTHHYEKFISPLELQRILDHFNCTTILINGSFYEFWSNSWKWVPTNTFCYALHAVKN